MTTSRIVRRSRQRVAEFVESLSSLKPDERMQRLEAELRERLVEQQLMHVQSMEAMAYERDSLDVRPDDDAIDEVSILRTARRVLSQQDLDEARDIGRALWLENEFALGAHTNRVNYTVGEGLRWRLVPIDAASENPIETRQVVGALDRFLAECDPDGFAKVGQEGVWRADRDGESFLDATPPRATDLPLQVRFREPEDLTTPLNRQNVNLGIETEPNDVRTVLGYYFDGAEGGDDPAPRPPLRGNAIAGIVHIRLNVALNSLHGWPTMHPIRRNLARAERLLRNMSYVAALQAAIALIRKHDTATRAEIEAFLAQGQDLATVNQTTGRETSHRYLPPGSIIDAPRGTTYEAPVSSVNAANNVEIHRRELQACAARLCMAEFMFSGDASGAPYASALVAEGPVSKMFRALQVEHGHHQKRLVNAGLRYEQYVGRISTGVLEKYTLVVHYPPVTVRDQLQEEQRRQIQRSAGVLSVQSWRGQVDLDDATEERHITVEVSRGIPRPIGAANGATNKPPGTPGAPSLEPGGAAKADPLNPQTARSEL